MNTLGWLLGLDNLTALDEVHVSFAARWAREGPFWVVLGCVCLLALAIFFYVRFQKRGSFGFRLGLGISRGLLLVLLFLTLAIPVLHTRGTMKQLPYLYFVFDGTDSMAIHDELPDAERAALAQAAGVPADNKSPSRLDYVKALISQDNLNLLEKLRREKECRVEAFVFDGNTTSQLRKLQLNAHGGESIEPVHLADQLTSKGQVTALGTVLSEVGQQLGTGNLAGVVLVSDFDNNSGLAPLGNRRGADQSPASRLGVPVYTVGVGATESIDVAVDLQTNPKIKKAEKTDILVKLRQSGLSGQSVTVRVKARRLSGDADVEGQSEFEIGQKTVTLSTSYDSVSIPYTPQDSGRFEFVAEVDTLSGEVVVDNNRAAREVNIIDDYLRLMYVAHEPTWEWRFVKEVFHRDKLVGMQGFRTYLASSDPRVRETNVLFLPTLTPKRSDFFANDVIFLGDMPRTTLSDRFCNMVKEFVGQFGGGLVVIAGPRFGPRELSGTPLADMLPVVIDAETGIRDDQEFRLQLTPQAPNYPFMNLGENDVENAKAWDNLGLLPWYQPVAQKHDLAEVLAEHPNHTCRDGKTPQPLIAVRRYGAGEVVYVGFNEMWRLRKKYGDKYYRQFWSQLIYRLGMSHALGNEKRFVVRTDRHQYRVEEKVTLTVEGYDENFEPLTEEKLGVRSLQAEFVLPGEDGGEETRPLPVSILRSGLFETRVPVFSEGGYSIRVKDPVTGRFNEVRFDVIGTSAERRSGVRNKRLQDELASETKGRSYELTNVSNLLTDLDVRPVEETITRNYPLWNTRLWFGLLAVLMLGEWFIRKMSNMT